MNTQYEPVQGKSAGPCGYRIGDKLTVKEYTPLLCKCTMVAAHPGPLLILTLWSSGRKQKNKLSDLQWDVNIAGARE